MIPLVNGQAYDYTQIIMTVLGVPIAGVSAINYTQEQEKVDNYGAGKHVVSRGHGAITASGSIELSMNEIEALRDVAPNGSLLEIPAFTITVTYLNLQKVVTHKIKYCEFTNDGVEASQGDTDIKTTLNLAIGSVQYR